MTDNMKKRMGVPILTCQKELSLKTYYLGALHSTTNEERKMTRICASQKTTKITVTTKERGEALTRQAVRHPCSGGQILLGKGVKRYKVIKQKCQESSRRLTTDWLIYSEEKLIYPPSTKTG